jgi:hypothetical protein
MAGSVSIAALPASALQVRRRRKGDQQECQPFKDVWVHIAHASPNPPVHAGLSIAVFC